MVLNTGRKNWPVLTALNRQHITQTLQSVICNQALGLFCELHRRELERNLITYSAVISACEKGLRYFCWYNMLSGVCNAPVDAFNKTILKPFSTSRNLDWHGIHIISYGSFAKGRKVMATGQSFPACMSGGAWLVALQLLSDLEASHQKPVTWSLLLEIWTVLWCFRHNFVYFDIYCVDQFSNTHMGLHIDV